MRMVARFCIVGLLLIAFTGTAAAIELFDDKVVIHGKWSNQYLRRVHGTKSYENDYKVFNARSSLKLEVMWHAYDGPDYSLNFYSVWKQFYDGAHDIDSRFKNQMKRGSGGTRNGIDQINYYNDFKDVSRELYLEFNAPIFQVRLGKQIVSWGETGFERMVDNINPVDLRGNLNPAYPDFAEIKRGLWMARLFLTPEDQVMDMSYELLIIPDFEPTRNWPAGYFYVWDPTFAGVPPSPVTYADQLFKAYYRDAPSDDWKKPEIGIRVRGFLAGWDWTLSYFHHRADDPVFKDNALGTALTGAVLGTRVKNVYRYPWYDTFGFTVNKPVDITIPIIPGTTLAMSGNIFRLEALYERDKPVTRFLDPTGFASRITKLDRYAVCLGWSTKIFLPGITPWARNKYLSSTTQLFYERMPDRKSGDQNYPWVTYAQNKTSWKVVTQELSYELWNGRILPGFYGAYYLDEGGGYYAPALGFKPWFKHTFLVRYMNYFGLGASQADLNSKDFLTFEYTYEF